MALIFMLCYFHFIAFMLICSFTHIVPESEEDPDTAYEEEESLPEQGKSSLTMLIPTCLKYVV